MANYFISIESTEPTEAETELHVAELSELGELVHLQFAMFFLASDATAEAIKQALAPHLLPADRLVIVEALNAISLGYTDEWAAVMQRWKGRTVFH